MYFALMTETGLAKRAAAEASGVNLVITQMAVGDGGGSDVTPLDTMTALVNEVWRGDVELVSIHPDNDNWITAECKIPINVGGFWIREVGMFDADGDLIIIGNYPATQKPVLAEGVGQDLYIRLVAAVENTAAIEVTIDPEVVMATRQYVDALAADLAAGVLEAKRRAYFYANTI